ncbi:MAG: hypothetical protein JNK60_12410 [Acidobacteria bacterium]|nr:hypothetical protein [Acidobacteriota bacterium]
MKITKKTGAGTYRSVAGHHIHAKKGFEGHGTYDFREAFAVSDDLLKQYGVRHANITPIQQKLFKKLEASGLPNNLTQHSRIAFESLVKAGIPRQVAKDWVARSQRELIQGGVFEPTLLPWGKK